MDSGKIGEFLAMEDDEFTMGVLTDNYFGFAKGNGRVVGLDLADNNVEMAGHVLGDSAGLLPRST